MSLEIERLKERKKYFNCDSNQSDIRNHTQNGFRLLENIKNRVD